MQVYNYIINLSQDLLFPSLGSLEYRFYNSLRFLMALLFRLLFSLDHRGLVFDLFPILSYD